jgi:hypothetical protein
MNVTINAGTIIHSFVEVVPPPLQNVDVTVLTRAVHSRLRYKEPGMFLINERNGTDEHNGTE